MFTIVVVVLTTLLIVSKAQLVYVHQYSNVASTKYAHRPLCMHFHVLYPNIFDTSVQRHQTMIVLQLHLGYYSINNTTTTVLLILNIVRVAVLRVTY